MVTRLKVVCCGLLSWHTATLPSFDDGTKESARYRSLRRSSIRFVIMFTHDYIKRKAGEYSDDLLINM